MRYHKDVYFSDKYKEDIIKLTYILNSKPFRYTSHCLDNARLRVMNLEQLLYFIKNELKLNSEDVFEFYTDGENNIFKLCYRFTYSNTYDIILVIGLNKEIITLQKTQEQINSEIANTEKEVKEMLNQIGVSSVNDLFKDIPKSALIKNLKIFFDTLTRILLYR